ncbi:CPBP family intramembrane glutamic endopeptidase [Streptococcus orisasini]|uniref:CPBP family intramembrane glutamic endopeptidase n=1 Tax=Streptococcus orisasini TaxID=1080071 RepID=UPI0007101230|nr:type II CAAX endopeptidase family protein [Streptococcus orisasini]
MKKRILEAPTLFYQKIPSWLFLILACIMVYLFIFAGSFIGGLITALLITILHLIGSTDLGFNAVFSSFRFWLFLFFFASLLVFAWVKWVEKRPISSLGLFKDNWFKAIVKGWAVGTFIFTAAFLLIYLFGGVELQATDFSAAAILYVLSIIPFWFIQGGTEELLTRGWLLPLINKRSNLAVAIGISSSLFGLMHLVNNHVTVLSVTVLILSGIFMALYMLKTDNLWGVAGLHGAWNFTQGNIFGAAVSGTDAGKSLLHFVSKAGAADWISGGKFGAEGSLLTSLVLLVGIVILGLLLKRESKTICEEV